MKITLTSKEQTYRLTEAQVIEIIRCYAKQRGIKPTVVRDNGTLRYTAMMEYIYGDKAYDG